MHRAHPVQARRWMHRSSPDRAELHTRRQRDGHLFDVRAVDRRADATVGIQHVPATSVAGGDDERLRPDKTATWWPCRTQHNGQMGVRADRAKFRVDRGRQAFGPMVLGTGEDRDVDASNRDVSQSSHHAPIVGAHEDRGVGLCHVVRLDFGSRRLALRCVWRGRMTPVVAWNAIDVPRLAAALRTSIWSNGNDRRKYGLMQVESAFGLVADPHRLRGS